MEINPDWATPTNPEAEFRKMNTADTAAASLTEAHLIKIKIGLRRIPPPIPIKPEKKPNPVPMANPNKRFGLVNIISLFWF